MTHWVFSWPFAKPHRLFKTLKVYSELMTNSMQPVGMIRLAVLFRVRQPEWCAGIAPAASGLNRWSGFVSVRMLNRIHLSMR